MDWTFEIKVIYLTKGGNEKTKTVFLKGKTWSEAMDTAAYMVVDDSVAQYGRYLIKCEGVSRR